MQPGTKNEAVLLGSRGGAHRTMMASMDRIGRQSIGVAAGGTCHHRDAPQAWTRLRHQVRCCTAGTAATKGVGNGMAATARSEDCTAELRAATMGDGRRMPLLGLGTYLSEGGDETERSCLAALASGYRHIDTAQGYNNEGSVGAAIARSGLPRAEVFVTTKLW